MRAEELRMEENSKSAVPNPGIKWGQLVMEANNLVLKVRRVFLDLNTA